MIVIVGAGMGGLTAAAWLARRGRRVLVLEARPGPGGLASGFEAEGLRFDAGPYLLLDRPGLEWVFRELGAELDALLPLRRVDEPYQVERENGPTVRILGSLDRTAAEMDRTWPGAGERYGRFIEAMATAYERLSPIQYDARPGPAALFRHGAWREIPFLLRSLSAVMARAGLPREVVDALTIWTHVAGQRAAEAPSPMAFVPALIHRHGCYVPEGGIGEVPRAVERIAREAGAEFRYGVRVTRIRRSGGQVIGVETGGERIEAEAVITNAGGVGSYMDLLEGTPEAFRRRLSKLPLQSPGVSAYLAVEGTPGPSYLRFRLPGEGLCRLLVASGVVDPARAGTARLIGPVDFEWAERAGPEGQRAYLERLLEEPWWRSCFRSARPVARRIPADWGAQYHLYRNSMNPVMTAKFMRQGRLAHRSPVAGGFFLAGSATHPGQWVSFAAISGILAAKELAC